MPCRLPGAGRRSTSGSPTPRARTVRSPTPWTAWSPGSSAGLGGGGPAPAGLAGPAGLWARRWPWSSRSADRRPRLDGLRRRVL